MKRVVDIVPTGLCNLASVRCAFERLGAEVRLATTARSIRDARALVLPGVGSFGVATATLRNEGLEPALQERCRLERPLLAICLGMQLLFETSEESPGSRGLEAFAGTITPLPQPPRRPLIGWNDLRPEPGCRLLEEGYAYFVHGYCLEEVPGGCTGALANYGSDYVAAFERGTLLACQFHPELSGRSGARLLERWLERGERS